MSAPARDPPAPTAPPAVPPPGGAGGHYSRRAVATQDGAVVTSGTAQPTKPSLRAHHHHRHSQPDASPEGLTASALDRAFGRAGQGPDPQPATGATAGSGGDAAAATERRRSHLIAPSAKEGSDSVSMYSLSQSILPVDPRDRLYYRPRRHLLQCYVDRVKDHSAGLAGRFNGAKGNGFNFHLEHTNDFVLSARVAMSGAASQVEDLTDGIQGQSYTVKHRAGNVLFSAYLGGPAGEFDTRGFVGKLSVRSSGDELVLFSEGDKATRKELASIHFLSSQDDQLRFEVILPAIDQETGFIRPVEGGSVKFLREGRGTSSVVGGSRAGIDAMMANSDEDAETIASRAPVFDTAPGAADGAGAEMGKRRKFRSHSRLLQTHLANPSGSPAIIVLQQKLPQWDNVIRGYKLDFHGRAAKASAKNFQLVSRSDPEKVVMLFGRQSDNRFSVDYRFPLCGLQAGAIASAILKVS